jgi:hypothetical protein
MFGIWKIEKKDKPCYHDDRLDQQHKNGET